VAGAFFDAQKQRIFWPSVGSARPARRNAFGEPLLLCCRPQHNVGRVNEGARRKQLQPALRAMPPRGMMIWTHAREVQPDRHGLDPQRANEWIEALDQVIETAGLGGAVRLLDRLSERGGLWAAIYRSISTGRIPTRFGPRMRFHVQEIASWSGASRPSYGLTPWLLVVRQNKEDPGIGGHIATYASRARLVEVGFHHFFRAQYGDQPGDLVYLQGHASPGAPARSWRAASAKSICEISGTGCAARRRCPLIRIRA
jgi:hypothetical protein